MRYLSVTSLDVLQKSRSPITYELVRCGKSSVLARINLIKAVAPVDRYLSNTCGKENVTIFFQDNFHIPKIIIPAILK